MNPTIVFTVNDRPHYLERVLESWSKVRGIEHAQLVFCCEPGCPPVQELCCDANFAKRRMVHVNARKRGVDGNPRFAFELGFELSDFVIQAEDDDVVSTDVLEFFEWSERRWRDDTNVLSVCAFEPWGARTPSAVRRHPEFRPTVCGLWRWDWESRFSKWDLSPDMGWDNFIQQEVAPDHVVVRPMQSRAQHIGRVGTKSMLRDIPIESLNFEAQVAPQDYREIQ